MRQIKMSICLYQNGEFDVFIEDADNKLCLTGKHKLTKDDMAFANRIAPACVMTTYERVTPED